MIYEWVISIMIDFLEIAGGENNKFRCLMVFQHAIYLFEWRGTWEK